MLSKLIYCENFRLLNKISKAKEIFDYPAAYSGRNTSTLGVPKEVA